MNAYTKYLVLTALVSTLIFYTFASIPSDHKKWIVITSIQHPTIAVKIKKLSLLRDWHLVVVADKKTPIDWELPNCEYLSIEKQQQLPYRIVKLLPWNHYCRKNIGYLYAIEHGAQVIYDTDDDNILKIDSIPYLPESCIIEQYSTKNRTVNPYEYFGQPTVWPRGYPLEHVLDSPDYTINKTFSRPFIQQGVVDNDPDVDAIFRLTRQLPVFFDHSKQPISLPPGTMAPFNSQNTVFHYEAFWGLLIPMTTAFRVCDIWRGYWVQRILWDIGAVLAFLPPAVVQERNEHNLLKDFEDEHDLYCKAGKLVRLLCSWKSNKQSLEERISELTALMIQQEFYAMQEQLLVDAWLADLHAIGYSFPELIN